MNNKPDAGTFNRRTCLAAIASPLLGHPVVQAQTAAKAPAKAEAKTEAKGVEIIIGQSAPLSGSMAILVSDLLDGQNAAITDINKRGGVNGRPIKLITLDDAYEPKRTLENAKTLVEREQAVALFGVVGTAQSAAVLPYVAERIMPLISIYSGSPALRSGNNPYLFTTQASYTDELVKMVRNLVTLRSTKIAVVYQNNELGKLLLPVAEKVLAAEGATMAASLPLQVDGRDSNAVAQQIAANKPNAIILIVAGPAVVPFVKANKALSGVPVYTFSLSVGGATLKGLGEDARGLAVARSTPYPWRATNALTRDFNAAMKRHKYPIDYGHFTGYINGRILIEGIRSAGKNVSPEGIYQGMEKLGRLDLGGYALNFGPNNHHGSNFVEITIVGPNGTFMR
ncbi:MAG: ABC transporter substrate-binding protein [Burkholderiaceae bacterium]